MSSVLPQTPENERFTLLAAVGVTLLMSILAMILYPLGAHALGLTPAQARVLFGATIHDVAQVVVAGMILSDAGNTAAADSATVVKLFRVMMLMPGFLLAFIVFMLLATSSMVPPALVSGASTLSSILLVAAIAAAGVKTNFEDLFKLGWTPVLMLLGETPWIRVRIFEIAGLLAIGCL